MALTKLIRLSTALLAVGHVSGATSCKPGSVVKPDLFGIGVLDISVKQVKGWAEYGPIPTFPKLPAEHNPLDFCNVTVTYTHPGLNDTINVHVWLPLSDRDWNGRFLGQGGGGFLAGGEGALGSGVALGYAAANTDAGHNAVGDLTLMTTCDSWALTSPGNVNQVLLQDFGYRVLDDLAHIAKAVIKDYYKKDARYAYWNGCSTGGRQGLVLAQRYPDQFDGILAAAPAINWVTFLVTEHWAHVIMKKLNYFPPACELTAITTSAIDACDGLDGVKDGMVAAPGLCKFDPQSVVGQQFDCEGDRRKITKEAAQIAAAVWTGPTKDGKPVWFGLTHEASLIGYHPGTKGLARTSCSTTTSENCRSDYFPISAAWIRYFLKKNPAFDISEIDEDAFFDLMRISRQEFYSVMDSADPDLRPFHKSGGKMITWHGLADQVIMPNGSSNYYERVRAISPDVQDFYRYFEVPGVEHCAGGPGAVPGHAFTSLVDWVENGKAPDRLDAESLPTEKNEIVKARPICAYPLVAAYKGGDTSKASSFECAASFNAFGKGSHDEL